MENEGTRGLILQGSAKLGKKLIDLAAKQGQEKIEKQVVSNITELLEQVAIQRKNLQILEDSIDALRAGAFILNKNGGITFTDPDLNVNIRWTSTCGQCGYDKTVIGTHRGAY